MTINHHSLALLSIVGSSLDLLGALYLAYDLLGGEHGPLRTLTRGVTYGVLFGVGYGLALGPVFGLASGLAHAMTLAVELSRAARHAPKSGLWMDSAMSAVRGAGFGLGAAYLFGTRFGLLFGLLSTVGQVVAYRFGIRPALDYQPVARPRLTRHHALAALNRAVGYTVTGYVSALAAHQHLNALTVGVKTGLAIGLVTGVFSIFTSYIEWAADHIPQRTMGAAGLAFILAGFALQSVQYWVSLLDVTVR